MRSKVFMKNLVDLLLPPPPIAYSILMGLPMSSVPCALRSSWVVFGAKVFFGEDEDDDDVFKASKCVRE